MKHGFEVTWEAKDGYVSEGRPQHITIDRDEIDPDMTEAQLRTIFFDTVQADFEQTVSWSTDDEEDFVEWAKEVQKEMIEEDEKE